MENFPDISQHLQIEEGFCYPDWWAISDLFEASVREPDKNAAWVYAAKKWLSLNAENLNSDYQLHTTDNFIVLTNAPKRVAADTCFFCEYALKEIMAKMEGVASDVGYGKHVVMMFSNEDDYYRYISYFCPDGDHPASSGMCLHGGYDHFVFPSMDHSSYRTVAVHELTHICLGHLPLPTWVNEALAMVMEEIICGSDVFHLDRESYDEHMTHWNHETIQQFWSGISWTIPGESSDLSYNLAQILWRKIETDMSACRDEIVKFVVHSDWKDGGETSFQRVFDLSLGALVEDFLGEGDWTPKPHLWPKEPADHPSADL